MGEAKRRKQLDPTFGQGRGAQLRLTSRGYIPMSLPKHFENFEDAAFDYCVPVVIVPSRCDRKAVCGLVLFSYRSNDDGLGIDSKTGRPHGDDFHLVSKIAAFDEADWLTKEMAPSTPGGLSRLNPLASEIAKKSIRLIETVKRSYRHE
jgi:hypothetical protein